MPDNSTHSRRLRPAEAADHANLSESFLAKLRMRGDGPRFIKVGKAVLYDSVDIDRWLESQKRLSTSEAA